MTSFGSRHWTRASGGVGRALSHQSGVSTRYYTDTQCPFATPEWEWPPSQSGNGLVSFSFCPLGTGTNEPSHEPLFHSSSVGRTVTQRSPPTTSPLGLAGDVKIRRCRRSRGSRTHGRQRAHALESVLPGCTGYSGIRASARFVGLVCFDPQQNRPGPEAGDALPSQFPSHSTPFTAVQTRPETVATQTTGRP